MTQLILTHTLYPDWDGENRQPPEWIEKFGLSKCIPLVSNALQSKEYLDQAEQDGLHHLTPIITLFKAEPAQIKKQVGGEIWRAFRTTTHKANVNRLVLIMLGGWTIEEALILPTNIKGHAKSLLGRSKTAILLASKLSTTDQQFKEHLTLCEDVQRMNGILEKTWGKKRLKREHDALVIKRMTNASDPTPWDKPWFFDCDGYTFSLLKSETELAIEGARQRHCVRSYAHACRNGLEIVVSIQGRERATASWRVIGSETPQIKGFANSNVSKDLILATVEARQAFSKRTVKK